MAATEKRNIALAVDLARPVRSEELIEKLLDGTPSITTTIVKTEKGPLMVLRYRERTFLYMHELMEHLRSTGILDSEALQAT